MIDTIKEILKQGGNLKALIEKSLRGQEIWICDNRLGMRALNNLWNMLESQFKAKEAKEQQKIIEISQKYKESIQEFIAYRNSKGRYFNRFALNKFLLELARFEYLKIDVVKQSIKALSVVIIGYLSLQIEIDFLTEKLREWLRERIENVWF